MSGFYSCRREHTHAHTRFSLLSSALFPSLFLSILNIGSKDKGPRAPLFWEPKCERMSASVGVCMGLRERRACAQFVCALLQIGSLWISQEQQQGKWGVKVSGLLRINRNSLINHPTATQVCVCVCVGACRCVGAYQMDLLELCPALMLLQLMHMCSGHPSKCHVHTHMHVHSPEYWALPISLIAANETTMLCYCIISLRLDISRRSGLRCIGQTVWVMRDHARKHGRALLLSGCTAIKAG